MKRGFPLVILFLVGLVSFPRLCARWKAEHRETKVALAFDWYALRALLGPTSPEDLLKRSHEAGFRSILLAPLHFAEILKDPRVRETQDKSLEIHDIGLAHQVAEQVARLKLPGTFKNGTLSSPTGFDTWSDVSLGYDRGVIEAAAKANIGVLLRVEPDPLRDQDELREMIREASLLPAVWGILPAANYVPKDTEQEAWQSMLRTNHLSHSFLEFKPSRFSRWLANHLPESTFRTHTIPLAELRELSDEVERARWLRSVDERSCKILILPVVPERGLVAFMNFGSDLSMELTHRGYTLSLPDNDRRWTPVRLSDRWLWPIVLLALAIFAPAYAVLQLRPLMTGTLIQRVAFFVLLSLISVTTGLIIAAWGHNPLTRLEIVPFRGIKLAFAGGWALAVAALYPWSTWKTSLDKGVRRFDLVVGCLVLGVVAYMLIRSGNAGAAWANPAEQHLRQMLEWLMGARPRFKEFAVGHPLLIAGLLWHGRVWRRRSIDGRPLMALGLIGQMSMINTFCHFHSPLEGQLLRSINGLVLGAFCGVMLFAASRLLTAWGDAYYERK